MTVSFASLLQGILNTSPGSLLMIAVGCILIYLAVVKEYEPMLLIPIGAGAILANLPLSPMIADDGMLEILKKSPEVRWKYDANNKFVELQHWYNISALIGHIMADAKERTAVRHLMAVLDSIIANNDTWSLLGVPTGPDTDFGANPILTEIDGRQVVGDGTKGSTFHVFDRKTGEIIWERKDLSSSHTQANGGVLMNGATDGKRFYVVSNQPPGAGLLHALVHKIHAARNTPMHAAPLTLQASNSP